MSINITIDTSQYDSAIATVRSAITNFVPKFIQEATPVIQQAMADNVPVKTGNLRASIYSEIDDVSSTTRTNTGYGKFVDQPTAAHFIRPKVGRYLRFTIGSQIIYAKQVYHPGTKGAFFIQKTLDQVSGQIVEIAKAVWSSLVS